MSDWPGKWDGPTCFLCGLSIDNNINPDFRWLARIRIIHQQAGEQYAITRVGISDDLNFEWPSSNDSEIEPKKFDLADLYGIGQPPACIFHDSCFQVLKLADPAVPIHMVWHIRSAFHSPQAIINANWGHDYGGILKKSQDCFPWDNASEETWYTLQDAAAVVMQDPRCRGEVSSLLNAPYSAPPQVNLPPSALVVGHDPFARLPEELIEMIAILLPTLDFLEARYASRAFWPIFHVSNFWASRFNMLDERSWLFEAKTSRFRDWRGLYMRTTDSRLSPTLRNRKRVGTLVQRLLGIIRLKYVETGTGIGSARNGLQCKLTSLEIAKAQSQRSHDEIPPLRNYAV
ncbi:hypothetical protein ACHAPT_001868 [Fusarium lateritium]